MDRDFVIEQTNSLNSQISSGISKEELSSALKSLSSNVDFYFSRQLFIEGIQSLDDAFSVFDPDELKFEPSHDLLENHSGIVISLSDKGTYNLELAKLCRKFKFKDIGDLSDGSHTFNELYDQRCVLFQTLVSLFKDKSWKSKKHEDGIPCFDGTYFIVGIDTPEGPYTYHYKIEYFEDFPCKELPVAKHWDGHTDKDVKRLLSLI